MAGSKKILFVEDDKYISEMYARVLTGAGYHVDFAYTGTDGLTKAQTGVYDLILLDIMMPGKTGIEILHELQDSEFDKRPKIVILTNLAQDESSKDALKSKADGYLIKADVIPSKLAELVGRLI